MLDVAGIDFSAFAQGATNFLEIVGVVAILGGAAISTLVALTTIFRKRDVHHVYKSYRNNLARSILIGLEFLIAADIIRSVAGNLTFENVIVLGVIVLIRLLLGIEFEMEIEGRWPWKKGKKAEL